jgi:hypothetical protein
MATTIQAMAENILSWKGKTRPESLPSAGDGTAPIQIVHKEFEKNCANPLCKKSLLG